jgi:galactose mutarotase-like enzyme
MIEIQTKDSKLTVNPDGGQVMSWQVFENSRWYEILYQGSVQKRTGIPILFPFANPLENNLFNLSGKEIPSHGFGRLSNWQVDTFENTIILSLTDKDIDPEYQLAYPFKFQASIQLRLSPKTLDYELSVTNLSLENMPIAPGIHPYFRLSHDSKNNLSIPEISDFKASEIDWNGDLDGLFFDYQDFSCSLINDNYEVFLKVANNSRKPDIKHLVVWSQNQNQQDSDFICLEPFTRGSNALNIDPIIVKPTKTWTQRLTFQTQLRKLQ